MLNITEVAIALTCLEEIVKRGSVVPWADGYWRCPYCASEGTVFFHDFTHTDTCPIQRARELLHLEAE